MYNQTYGRYYKHTAIMRKQLIKRKELFILLGILLAFALLLTLTTLFFSGKTDNGKKEKKEPTLVEGAIPTDKQNDHVGTPTEKSQKIGSEAFFLKPSADEVLTALRDADQLLQQPPENTPAMKVMWPGYFYSLAKNKTGDTIVQLDIDESGFGVILICTVKLTDYPEVKELKQGQKIWVAGVITAIDPEGTGNVFINVEYIRFDEGPVSAQ